MSSAIRQKRWRVRQALGVQLVNIEIDQETIEILISKHLMKKTDMYNHKRIARAMILLTKQQA